MRSERNYLGSSDAAAILGIDPWKTDEDVARRILEGIEPERDEASLKRMKWGTRLEDDVLDAFAEERGMVVERWSGKVEAHPRHPFIACKPDAMAWPVAARVGSFGDVVEAKTALPFPGPMKKWKDADGNLKVPENYATQCMHLLMCVPSAPRCWVPVLFGLERFEVLCVERDEEFIRDLEAAEVAFWNTRIAPFLKTEAA